jgi:hypothetical protein
MMCSLIQKLLDSLACVLFVVFGQCEACALLVELLGRGFRVLG